VGATTWKVPHFQLLQQSKKGYFGSNQYKTVPTTMPTAQHLHYVTKFIYKIAPIEVLNKNVLYVLDLNCCTVKKK
jgi:hypothetical protein